MDCTEKENTNNKTTIFIAQTKETTLTNTFTGKRAVDSLSANDDVNLKWLLMSKANKVLCSLEKNSVIDCYLIIIN